ncbi:hypothetical protein [Streptacidiphilus carbonis]|uniref:hypothetical protein n=1 Tax=Streptacidiphilus carbonis TaxID=105422 RepID=UPI0006941FD3|nr:hypothetical protein [Streptacidiphilus carbonis]
MNHDDENLVRQVLQSEALRYQPSDWAAGNAEAVRDRSAGRRRRVRGTVALALAVGATAAAAVGAALADAPGSAREVAAPGPSPVSSAPARPPTSATSTPGGAPLSSPAVRIVPPDQDVTFGHQIWMRLTDSEACEDLGPAVTRAYNCSSVKDGNQAQGTVSLRESTDTFGTLYAPLYVGPEDVSRMTVEIGSSTYRATVVELAGRPGYATGYLWLPARSQSTAAPQVKITVYDAQGVLLAATALSGT